MIVREKNSLRLASQTDAYESYDDQAARALWLGHYEDAQNWADNAMTYSQGQRYERGMIRAARLQGAAALGLGDGRLGRRDLVIGRPG